MNDTGNWSLIFDLGDVIFNWSPKVGQSDLSIHLLKEVQSTEIWRQYICGLVPEVECYRQIASRFTTTPTEVAEIFDKARQTISLNIDVYNFVKSLKKQYPCIAHMYIMSNVSVVDWGYLQNVRGFSCDIFDDIFVSCEMENILAARSLGIHGIIFDGFSSLDQALLNLLSDPVKRGLSFLTSNSKRLHSVTSNGMKIRDNFSQLLIYEATGVLDVLDLEWHEKTWNYFIGIWNPYRLAVTFQEG
ncbi:hypothetical protein DTO195F2_3782 [Paecilomyces variotii]|nr:hypothetical protein DTO195F2_3782 [Paecilomyces variotii]